MADFIFLILLIIHVGAIAVWLGGGILFSSVIAPTLQNIQASARAEFLVSAIPRYVRFILASAIAAIIAGVALFGYIAQATTSLAPSGSGLIYVEAGTILGLIAFIFGAGVVYPSGMKLASVLKRGTTSTTSSPQSGVANSPNETTRLQGRLRMGASVSTGLLAITLILMLVGASI